MAKLIAKGAEADLWLDLDWYGLEVVIKVRGEKKYRHPKLDREIRRARTIQEASILHRVKGAGVTTPLVYHVDPENAVRGGKDYALQDDRPHNGLNAWLHCDPRGLDDFEYDKN